MEVTRLIEALTEFRRQYEQPVSYLQVVRDLVMRAQHPTLPPMFTEEQRCLLLSNIDCLTAILTATRKNILSCNCLILIYEREGVSPP